MLEGTERIFKSSTNLIVIYTFEYPRHNTKCTVLMPRVELTVPVCDRRLVGDGGGLVPRHAARRRRDAPALPTRRARRPRRA